MCEKVLIVSSKHGHSRGEVLGLGALHKNHEFGADKVDIVGVVDCKKRVLECGVELGLGGHCCC